MKVVLSPDLNFLIETALVKESQAIQIYDTYARILDINEYWDIVDAFKNLALAETEHEYALFDFSDSPVRRNPGALPIGTARDGLNQAIDVESVLATSIYPDAAAKARGEGHVVLGELLDNFAVDETAHIVKLCALLEAHP